MRWDGCRHIGGVQCYYASTLLLTFRVSQIVVHACTCSTAGSPKLDNSSTGSSGSSLWRGFGLGGGRQEEVVVCLADKIIIVSML